MGKFAVQSEDIQTNTIAKLTPSPLEGAVPSRGSTTIDYKLTTSILGEVSFVTAVISSPGGGTYETKMPLRIEALSIGK